MPRYSPYLGSSGADEVQNVENMGDGQTVCTKYGEIGNTETYAFRRQSIFYRFCWLPLDRLAKSVSTHAQAL